MNKVYALLVFVVVALAPLRVSALDMSIETADCYEKSLPSFECRVQMCRWEYANREWERMTSINTTVPEMNSNCAPLWVGKTADVALPLAAIGIVAGVPIMVIRKRKNLTLAKKKK